MSEFSPFAAPDLICSFRKNQMVIESFPVGELGCNTSLVYSPTSLEAIIVDPGNDAAYLLEIVKQKGLQVKCLIHTHAHFDHIGGSAAVHRQTQAPLWLHKGDNTLYQALTFQGMAFGVRVESPLPLEKFMEDDQRFGLEGSAQTLQEPALRSFIRAIYTPGHTPGSCSFYTDYFDHPILFSGDTLFHRSIGRTDLPGGDHNLILKSIKTRLFTLPDETFCIPGHGVPTRLHEEMRSNPFVGA